MLLKQKLETLAAIDECEKDQRKDLKTYLLPDPATGSAGTVLKTGGLARPPLVRSARLPPEKPKKSAANTAPGSAAVVPNPSSLTAH